jgi:hypothetical protein
MASRKRVRFTDYALFRMRQRDITESDVHVVLDRPASAHRHRLDGRSEVTGRIGARELLVIYRRRSRDVLVINAMWE